MKTFAFFITSHGFGHTARCTAIMERLQQIDASIRFHVFTQTPDWFFKDALGEAVTHHPVLTDVGLVQKNSMEQDFSASMRLLNEFYPFSASQVEPLAQVVSSLGCHYIVCDIAPLGLAVADQVGIPSILIENFTWDWIYAGYLHRDTRLKQHIEYLAQIYSQATYHIQARPFCRPAPDATLQTEPVARRPQVSSHVVREKLGIPEEKSTVLLSMGGTSWNYPFLDQLFHRDDLQFLIAGGAPQKQQNNNVILFPHRFQFSFPDILHASDAAIGKVGYSTLAEVYHARLPFGYVPPPNFRESPVLDRFIQKQMQGILFTQEQYQNGQWMQHLDALLNLPNVSTKTKNGADQAAQFLWSLPTDF